MELVPSEAVMVTYGASVSELTVIVEPDAPLTVLTAFWLPTTSLKPTDDAYAAICNVNA
jgi:hypothetical protein